MKGWLFRDIMASHSLFSSPVNSQPIKLGGGWKMSEIRWYRGKYKVKVLLKDKRRWLVEALETIYSTMRLSDVTLRHRYIITGERFVTEPRFLWRDKKGVERDEEG